MYSSSQEENTLQSPNMSSFRMIRPVPYGPRSSGRLWTQVKAEEWNPVAGDVA